MNRKTQRLTNEQRRVMLLLRAGAVAVALDVTWRSLHRRGLIVIDLPQVRLSEEGVARLEVKRGRKPGAMTPAAREFAERQLAFPLEQEIGATT